MTDDEQQIAALIEALVNTPVDYDIRKPLREEILVYGNAAVPQLIQLLHNPLQAAHVEAAIALSEIPDDRAIPALLTVLRNNQSGATQSLAGEALGKIGEPAISGLIDLLWEDEIIYEAQSALATIGLPALPSLLQMLLTPAKMGRASGSIAQFTDIRAVPYIRPLLYHQDAQVRYDAVSALENMGDVGAIPTLLNMLVDDPIPYVRHIAACGLKSLMEVGDAAAPELLQALHDEDMSVQLRVFDILTKIQDTAVVPSLTAMMRDAEPLIRLRIVDTLDILADETEILLFMEMLDEPVREIRKRVVKAIQRRRHKRPNLKLDPTDEKYII